MLLKKIANQEMSVKILLMCILVSPVSGCASTSKPNTAPVVDRSPLVFVDVADKKTPIASSAANGSGGAKVDKTKVALNIKAASASSVVGNNAISASEPKRKQINAVVSPKPQALSISKPPASKMVIHVVRPKETLFSIALRYDADYQRLAKQNKIEAPFNIQIGQQLKISNDDIFPGVTDVTSEDAAIKATRNTMAASVSKVNEKSSASVVLAPERNAPQFVWPYIGKIAVRFNQNNSKGIAIEKAADEQVVAVADGKVLYAGAGLKGYGNLLIVKHNDRWLSAYAHNKRLLIKEGQMVKQGQSVALIGQNESSRSMLHFELRYLGKPVDPLLYLPVR